MTINPHAKYNTPQNLLDDPKLAKAEKIRLLQEWAVDENLKAVAEEENMLRTVESGHNQLSLVLKALLSLGVEFDPHGAGASK
jgi:hypothetical protein